MKNPVTIIGNGPSSNNFSISDLPRKSEIVRANFFFLEDSKRYGNIVDHYFWSLNNPDLHDGLVGVLREGEYIIKKMYSPVPAHDLTFRKENGEKNLLLQNCIYDHWKRISHNSELARYLMSRPLPTTGLQALATLAIAGYRDFTIVGMDFYQNSERYSYTATLDMQKYMNPKHFLSGYEKGAHSLEIDISFFVSILKQYPRIRINNITNNKIIDDIVTGKEYNYTQYSNPAY